MVTLPTADELSQSLSALLRRDVRARPMKVAAKGLPIAGTYVGGDGTPVGLVGADIAFAAYSGASFSLIPADTAQEAVDEKALGETLCENFAEVLNVLSRLFAVSGGGRVALKTTVFPPAAVPAQTATASVSFEVEVEDYGSGVLSLSALA